jgi:DNA-binding Xre family transcriptional regulator
MVRLIVKEIAEKRGIKNPFALSKATGINYANCHKLWQGNQKMISVDTVDKLCEALGCTPNDLLVFTPSKRSKSK